MFRRCCNDVLFIHWYCEIVSKDGPNEGGSLKPQEGGSGAGVLVHPSKEGAQWPKFAEFGGLLLVVGSVVALVIHIFIILGVNTLLLSSDGARR